MNLKRIYVLALVITGLFTEGISQGNKDILKLSISEAQDYAIQNNRSVKSSRIDVEIATKKVRESLAQGFPQLNLAANYQHQFVVPEISFAPYLDVPSLPDAGYLTKSDIENAYKDSPKIPLGVKNNTLIDLTLSQLIFSGQYLVGIQAVKVLKEVTEKSLAKNEALTRESVAGTYYLYLVLAENEKVLNENLKAVEQTSNELIKMNEQGLNEETDVDQIKINRSNLIRLITSIGSQREISMKLLKYQLGIGFDQQLVLTDSLPGIISQSNLHYLASPRFNVKNNIDYQLVSNQEKISALLLKLEKSKYLPTITSFYRHEEQTNQPSFNFAVKDFVGVTLSLPITSSGQRNAKISQAKYDLEKSRLDKENAEQSLIMEFETAWTAYQTAFSNFSTNSESMVLSKKIYDKTLIKYHEGVSSSFELSQNQTQYLIAESAYYNSILSLLNAKAKLDRILEIN
jgi:outer membrane protein TolC